MLPAGNPQPAGASPTDDIVANIANNNVPGAVSAISRSFRGDDLEAIQNALAIASGAGRDETAIKSVVTAAGKNVLSEETAGELIEDISETVPPANAPILSGRIYYFYHLGIAKLNCLLLVHLGRFGFTNSSELLQDAGAVWVHFSQCLV